MSIIEKFLTIFTSKWGKASEWLKTDNAGEYTCKVVLQMLEDMDITHVPTIAYTPEQNGIAERINDTLLNAVRAALNT